LTQGSAGLSGPWKSGLGGKGILLGWGPLLIKGEGELTRGGLQRGGRSCIFKTENNEGPGHALGDKETSEHETRSQ